MHVSLLSHGNEGYIHNREVPYQSVNLNVMSEDVGCARKGMAAGGRPRRRVDRGTAAGGRVEATAVRRAGCA